MSALMRSSRILGGAVMARSAVSRQTIAPALARCFTEVKEKSNLSEADRIKREAWRDKMQYPDHTPTYIRGGGFDQILLAITYLLVGFGTLNTFYRIYVRLQDS